MTKNLLKVLAMSFVTALGALVAPQAALAVNGADAQSQFYDATAMAGGVSGGAIGSIVSTTTVMTLSYAGSAATAADAEITVHQTAGKADYISFFAPAATLATDIGGSVQGQASGTFDLTVSTVATFGQLCDLINQSAGGEWHCTLTGVTRADSPAQILNTALTASAGVNSLKAVGGYQVAVGTASYMALGIIPATGRRVILEQCLANQVGTTFQVYGRSRKYSAGVDQWGNQVNDSSLVWSSVLTSNTLAYIPQQYAIDPWIEFAGASQTNFSINNPPVGALPYNGHVVVKASNYGAGNALQATSNYIQCQWAEK